MPIKRVVKVSDYKHVICITITKWIAEVMHTQEGNYNLRNKISGLTDNINTGENKCTLK